MTRDNGHPIGSGVFSSFCWTCRINTCCNEQHPHISIGSRMRVPKKNCNASKWKLFEKYIKQHPYYVQKLLEQGVILED